MIDFRQINNDALSRMPGLLPTLLPGGKAQGREYVFGDLAGNPGQSSSVNMETGQWADFATGDKGGDPVSLVAAIYGISQGDAAIKLSEMIGCTNETINRQTMTKGSWETKPAGGPPKSINHPKYGKPSATWKYYSPDAVLLGIVCRFDHADGSKDVIPFTHGLDSRSGKTDFLWRSFSEPRPLYGLDRLAQRIDAPVLVVEGEKAADAGQRLITGAVVLTWPGGSAAVSKADWSPLKGRRLTIWPDADEPGRKAAEAVASQALKAGAVEVFIIDTPTDKKKGWDAADAEVEGWTTDMAVKWIRDRRKKIDSSQDKPADQEQFQAFQEMKTADSMVSAGTHDAQKKKIVPVNITDFLGLQFPPRENLISPWLPSQGLAMVYAARGIGKTHFALGVAYAVASGGPFLGWQAESPAGVLYLDGEMPGVVMQERLGSIILSNDKEPSAPFILLTPDLQPEGMPRVDTEEGQQAIESVLTEDIKLIVVDNISTLAGAKENEADGWTPIQAWALRQRAIGRSVLFVHHSGKGGQQRGTSRREDVLDTVISLRRPIDYQPDQGAVFEIHFEKARGIYGDDVKSIEATLSTDEQGRMTWLTRTVEAGTFDRVVELLNEGLKQSEIAAELGLHKSNVSRHAQKAIRDGLVKTVEKTKSRGLIKKEVYPGIVEITDGGVE